LGVESISNINNIFHSPSPQLPAPAPSSQLPAPSSQLPYFQLPYFQLPYFQLPYFQLSTRLVLILLCIFAG
jgi:hypothetical protein